MRSALSTFGRLRKPGAPWTLLALFAAELLLLSVLYLGSYEFSCAPLLPQWVCAAGGYTIHRVLAVIAMVLLLRVARPEAFADLRGGVGSEPRALAINLAGIALFLLPLALGLSGGSAAQLSIAAVAWTLGLALAVGGALTSLAPWSAWTRLARNLGLPLLALSAVALLAPEIKNALSPVFRGIWLSDNWIAEQTFDGVIWGLRALGYDLIFDASTKVIGTADFQVEIHASCSGVQGLVLISGFLTLYLFLMRKDLAFPAVLVLYPIGLALSAGLNTLRIMVLIVIGLEGAPDLAVGGFHSYAGSLAFTLLAFGLIATANRMPVFRRAAVASRPVQPVMPLLQDPVAAQILPFVVFLLSGVILATIVAEPEVFYPWRFLAMAAILFAFLPHFLKLDWRVDPWAVGSGLAIALVWVLVDPPEAAGDSALAAALAQMSGPVLAIWIVARVLGTSIAVPLIEEVLFRGYMLDRLGARAGGLRMVLAVVLSSAAFAALHDRWLLAALAGVVFAGLVLRRDGRLVDAIVSHAVANAAIAAYAMRSGDWSVI